MGVAGLSLAELRRFGLGPGVQADPRPMTIEQIADNPFAKLDDAEGFTLVAFPDQVVTVTRAGQKYQAFGAANAGSSCGALAVDNAHKVRFLVSESDLGHGDSAKLERGLVNTSLKKFVIVYNLLLSAVYRARADGDTDSAATAFLKAAATRDRGCTGEDTFWNQVAYELEDGWRFLGRRLSDYVSAGRAPWATPRE